VWLEVFSEISFGVVLGEAKPKLGEVCWYINMYEALVDYCSIS